MKTLTILALIFAVPSIAAFGQTYPANIAAVDPSSLINVSRSADVATVRDSLRGQIFGSSTLDTSILPVFVQNYMDPVWAAIQNMGEMRVLTVPMALGVSSKIWRITPAVFRSADAGKCGFIVVAGHGQISVFPPYMALIEKLLYAGCEVTAIDLPFSGQNPASTVDTGKGMVLVQNHGNVQAAQTDSFNPLRWFVEAPLAVVNDYVSRGITNIGMVGLSGGGWTTDLYAAIDDRIDISYSIAGSMPMYMRSWVSPNPPSSLGDWEQMAIPSLGVGYLDLYVLGSVGVGRRHVNMYIVNDDCCFGGYNANHFAPSVTSTVAGISGSFSVAFDVSVSTHTISPWAANWIVTDMATKF